MIGRLGSAFFMVMGGISMVTNDYRTAQLCILFAIAYALLAVADEIKDKGE